ncbi:MAG: 4Fe-4S binding protein [Dethiobacter sp.]|jgi:NAD-dependent dihydropyrimidine dehydrogenase PreA subunit|nr:4Fe-4S binding protein [Dethiobacter sp.]
MAFRITDECLACGSCLDVCPSDAIKEGNIYTITEECADCGACVDECPQGCIIEE